MASFPVGAGSPASVLTKVLRRAWGLAVRRVGTSAIDAIEAWSLLTSSAVVAGATTDQLADLLDDRRTMQTAQTIANVHRERLAACYIEALSIRAQQGGIIEQAPLSAREMQWREHALLVKGPDSVARYERAARGEGPPW
eukprot:3200969-Amphidinium_carterae.1